MTKATENSAYSTDQYARMDKITLTGVGCVGYHGVLESEKKTGQPFFVDITMFTNFQKSAGSDNINDTVNYAEVAETIRDVITGDSLDLIETLAEKIASVVLETFPLEAVELTVHKPKAPIEVTFADVAVTIFREKKCW